MDLDDAEIERLAEAYHEHYLETAGTAASGPARSRWSQLPESLREANRASVAAIGSHLAALGLHARRVPRGRRIRVAVLDPEAVERAARAEHERWCAQKSAQGYIHGPAVDDEAQPPTHPDLTEWGDLDESDRDKDRERIRVIPRLLSTIGIEVVDDDA